VLVAAENTYDSAQLWLGSLRWDGVPRVERFLIDQMGCEDTPYTRAVALYMWSALAGRVIEPGVKADMVPIYEGDQGLRKSSSIEALSPAPEFFVELDFDKDEDDTVRSLRGALVGEVAELSGLHTRQIEWIKKFVVRKTEKWIPKYKEFATTFARRLLFIGTTNRTDILADETGNRRWLPVHITKADVEAIVASRDQLWAEGAVLFKQNGVMWHDAESLGAHEHADYTMEDVWETSVAKWLASTDDFSEGDPPRSERAFTTHEVMAGALHLTAKEQDRLAQKRVSAILRMFGYVQKTTRIGGVPTRAWRNASLRLCDVSRDALSVSDIPF
jgi:predicted P-loop ATPase